MAGLPIWYELMSPDPAGVAAFYAAVLGWNIPATGNPMPNGSEYRQIGRDDGGWQGGVLTLTPGMAESGVHPAWFTYFDVDDVDACVEKAKAMGAAVFMDPMTMEGIGRMSMLADPQGAPFYVMAPIPPEGGVDPDGAVFKGDTVGRATWNELNTDAADEQMQFYTSLFDWEQSGEMPMPGEHTYRFFNLGERGVGAIGSMKPDGMPNAWLPYFRVADINGAKRAVEENGGQILMGPQEVPGDDHIIVAFDPAGAAVGLVGRKS